MHFAPHRSAPRSVCLHIMKIATSIIEQLRQRTSFLSSTEVLKIMPITRKTLCAWVRKGVISAYKLDNAYSFDPVELADWIEARRT